MYTEHCGSCAVVTETCTYCEYCDEVLCEDCKAPENERCDWCERESLGPVPATVRELLLAS